MRSIDIITSQNVTINYELAELRDRFFAYLIDSILLYFFLGILYFSLLKLFYSAQQEQIFILVLAPIAVFYHLFAEIMMDGRSFGKKAVGIKVVKLNGIEPSLNAFILRWVFRPIDIVLSLGSIGSLLISSSSKGQRLGDIVANTTVIKVANSRTIKIKELLSIGNRENYEATYPQIQTFSEADMLLLKEVLDRYTLFKNDAHEKALNKAAEIVQQKLQLHQIPLNKAAFIRLLIKDYVALSR